MQRNAPELMRECDNVSYFDALSLSSGVKVAAYNPELTGKRRRRYIIDRFCCLAPSPRQWHLIEIINCSLIREKINRTAIAHRQRDIRS